MVHAAPPKNGNSGTVSVKGQHDVANDAALIQGIVVIYRDGLDQLPLSHSTSDNKLRRYATLLFKRIRADDSETALRKTVADIQIKLGLSVSDYRCAKIVSRAVALVRENSN
jgi:hypothetical protein